MEKPHIGDILLQQSKTKFGRAISFITKSKYSHVMVCLPFGKALDYNINTCRIVDVEDVQGDIQILRPKKINFLNKLRIIKNSFGWKKVEYDKPMIGKFVLLMPFKKKRHQLKSDPLKSICTKTAKNILEKSGVRIFDEEKGDYYTPSEFCSSRHLSEV